MSAPRFRLEAELGAGATGRVARGVLVEGFGAWPAGFPVAVKYLRRELAQDPAARARFEAEVRAGSAVRDPGVVHVLGTGEDARGRFLVMPYVPGESLREVLAREGVLPEPLARRIGRAVAGGLAALHAAGFAHGDVKPENVRLDAEGNAVLLDLGFATPLVPAAPSEVAPRPGSLAYVAPEQARGGAGGAASDVFALGVVLYELATGAHPFAVQATRDERAGPGALVARSGSSGQFARTALAAPDADRLLAAIATARHLPPSRLVPRVSPFLDLLLADLLQREPARRPSAAEVRARLDEQEAGTWWRSEVELSPTSRRGGAVEGDSVHLTPLVGRERELEALLAAWDATRAGPAVVWLSGAAGAGKSRLLAEFARRVRLGAEPPLVLYGRCRELDEDRPCRPVLRMVERWLRLPPDVAPTERDRAELGALVPPGTAEALARALDPAFAGENPRSLPAVLSEWVVALARRAPLVVHLDDAMWAGEGTLEVLGRAVASLAAQPGGARLCLVVGEREGAAARAPAALEALRARVRALGVEVRAVHLAPLAAEDVAELVERTFHHTAPRLKLAQVLWERSRGGPGLLSELLRTLVARGEARPHPDGTGFVLDVEPDDLPLPSSLRAAIAASYRALPAADRAWLRRLAVVGGRIETDFLLRAFPEARQSDVDAMLARLVRAGWLVPAGGRYRFARPAQREAVYRALSREQRTRLHAAAAAALAPRAAAAAAPGLEDEFQRAFHLRAAGDDQGLLDVVPALLGRLLKSGQPQRIAPLARWGLEALDRRPASPERERLRIVLLEAAADAADRLGMREDQRAALDHLSDSAFDPEEDPFSAGRVYLLHARYAVSTGQYGLARGLLRNAVELFERARSLRELSDALRRLALVQAHVGELEEAREHGERALEIAAGAVQRALAHLALATIDLLEDRVEPAMEHADRAFEDLRAERAGLRPGVLAAVHLLRARIYRSSGEPGRALGSAARAVRLARLAGERRLEAESLARLGQLHLDVDRLPEAEAELREALRLAEEIEDRRGQALARTFLGVLLWEADDAGSAAMLERAGQLAEEMGLNRITAVVSAVRARIALIQQRDHAAALVWSERAAEHLERYGAELADRIVILGTRALVLETAGLPDEARALERALRERLARENARVRSPLLRMRQSRAAQRLLEGVSTVDGPLYPRARIEPGELGGAGL